ncbi:MAG: hypothetical protein LQ340_002290 [Diploschistes diacapsis]|nr:MAG: hypothetical protein LQ340_002290 [Diploschistes diacapsis]
MSVAEIAKNIVNKRWIEQGIWGEECNDGPEGVWKHEEPPDLDSESDTTFEAETFQQSGLFSSVVNKSQRRTRTEGQKRLPRERRAVLRREREASRPYHQFVYQVSKERERISNAAAYVESDLPHNINTKAYDNVKHIWHGQGIWNEKWGLLPGMSWKHEEPLDLADLDAPLSVLRDKVENALHHTDPSPVAVPADTAYYLSQQVKQSLEAAQPESMSG